MSDPSHVVAVKAQSPQALTDILDAIHTSYPVTDVELHKTYAPTQANLYVRSGIKAEFDRFAATFPQVTTWELKDPTVFLAHSARMRPARDALERFMDTAGIRFAEPRVPVVSNHDMSLLTTASGVRRAILAMTDRVMASQDTCETLNSLDPDMILELGPGAKSVQLLRDNAVAAPVTGYTGSDADTDAFLQAVHVMGTLMAQLETLYTAGGRLRHEHHDVLRDLFRLAARSPFCDDYFSRALGRVITAEMLRPRREGSPAFYQFLEIFQHTRNYREHIAADRGELVTRARLKKRTSGAEPERLGSAYVELRVIGHVGESETRTADTSRPEVVVFHFGSLAGIDHPHLTSRIQLLLSTQPTALQIYRQALEGMRDKDALSPAGLRVVYQHLLFHTLSRYRPALFAQSDHYLEGADTQGWLTALAVSGALSPADAVELAVARPRKDTVERILSGLTGAGIPLLSPEGVPVQSRKELEETTRAVLGGGAFGTGVRPVRLNGNCQFVALDADLDVTGVDAGPYDTCVVRIDEPAEAWKKRLNPALDELEYASLLALTGENALVLENARARKVLSSTVCSYIGIDESVVNFGKGGSESMTIFVRKDGEDRVTVRKILSEALTTAQWDPDGHGVMLAPFAKARKQAEFLQSLPASVRDCFPEVYTVLERDVPIASHLRRGDRAADREVIYEMSYVAGEEVSRFVERQTPPPAVVARLYEQIIRVLSEQVHRVGRVPAPGETLDISYFRKIEDRLALCRRTAPRTFDERLLDTERIVVNGVSYLNAPTLLKRFRETPSSPGSSNRPSTHSSWATRTPRTSRSPTPGRWCTLSS